MCGCGAKKFKMRDMGVDGGCQAGVDIKTLALLIEQRFAEMEKGALDAGLRVQDLEEQAVKMRQEWASMVQSAADARNAYQQQRAFIKAQLGDSADATKLHELLHGLVATMDEQFGITGVGATGLPHTHEGSGFSPASSVGRGGGRHRQDRRRADAGTEGPAQDGENRRDRSPRLGGVRDGGDGSVDR